MPRPTLQLADPNYYLSAPNNAYLSAGNNMMLSADADEIYVKVPTQHGIIKVREDMFDTLDPVTYNAVMEYLIPFNDPNAQMMNGIFSKWKENRQERKDDRAQKKLDKIEARGDARANVAASGGGVGGILSKIGDIAGNILGGGGQQAPDQRQAQIGGSLQFGNTQQSGTPIYKQPWFWGILGAIGIGAVVLTKRH